MNMREKREKIWRVIRMNKGSFTESDIVQLTGLSVGVCHHYIGILLSVGYIKRIPIKKPKACQYVLILDTGVKAPVLKQIRAIQDMNTKEYYIPREFMTAR